LWGIVDYFTRWDDLKQKVQWKKVIINCLRLNKETEWLINADSLSWFDWFYVTAAECWTENQEDIIALLKSKILQWYARDGWVDKVPWWDAWNKSYQSFKQDLEWYNVFITPHIARSTTNAITYSNDICIESIEAYLLGNPINLLY
jgi:lactate dehydrogenase-like 2-hydroxyacid dehydrogenase